MSWVQYFGDPIQEFWKVLPNLAVHESLGAFDVFERDEAVVTAAIRETFPIHLSGQPFTSIHANLDIEGEPRLNPGVYETKDGIDHVVVEEQAFAGSQHQFQFFEIPVAIDVVAQTGFETGENSDEAVLDLVFLHDFPGNGFFICFAGGKILDGSARPGGIPTEGLLQILGDGLCISPKIFQKHLSFPEESFKSVGIGNRTQGSSEDQTIKPV